MNWGVQPLPPTIPTLLTTHTKTHKEREGGWGGRERVVSKWVDDKLPTESVSQCDTMTTLLYTHRTTEAHQSPVNLFDAHCCHIGTAIKHPVRLWQTRLSSHL